MGRRTRSRLLWLVKGLGRGGAERLLVSSAARLDGSRFDLEVAYVLPWKDALVPDLERLGVRVHCLGEARRVDVGWPSRLRRLVRARRFDLLHTHMPSIAVGARVLASSRVPIVHTEHNTWDQYRPLTRWANRLTYRRNAAVIAVSHAVAGSIRPCPGVGTWPPIRVIHYGAERPSSTTSPAQARVRARRTLGIPDDALVVGAVGNFTAKKDYGTLLEAMARAAHDHDELRLVLVGSGPLEHQLRERARSLGLTGRATFAGSRDDVGDLMPAFDVFALSSRHEGLPIALLEAMTAGVPCVATSVGGVPEVVTHGKEGLLVAPEDPVDLARALARMLDGPDLRRAAGICGARTAARFDIAQAVRCTEDLYRQVLETAS